MDPETGTGEGAAQGVDLALLDALFHHVSEVVVAFDVTGLITWVSPAVRQVLGHDPHSLVGQNLLDLVEPSAVPELLDAIQRWNDRTGAPRGDVHKVLRADGTWVPLRYDAAMGPALAALGAGVAVLRPVEDDRSGLEAELRARSESEARVVRIAKLFLHRDGTPFQRAVEEVVGELSGMPWISRVSVWRREGDFFRRLAQWVAPANAPFINLTRRLPVATSPILRRVVAGEEVHIRSSRHLPDDWAFDREVLLAAGVRSLLAVPLVVDGACVGAILAEVTIGEVAFDATHLATLRSTSAVLGAAFVREGVELELERQARTDPLTGIANRFAFDHALAEAMGELAGRRSQGVAVGLLDVDRFKRVNEALGHEEGDHVLQQVIARLVDAAESGTILARLGGDELLMAHLDTPDLSDALARTEALVEALREPLDVGGEPFLLTASTGVTHTTRADIEPGELLRRAEVAMYRAKEEGGDRIATDDVADSEAVSWRLRRETELRAAILDGDLEVHYQGEWDLSSGRLIGAEALARWQHPDEGLLPAGDFIPLAEESGLVVDLGALVVRDACLQLARWRRRGLDADFLLRINLSAHQLREHTVVPLLLDVLEETRVPPESLCFELTESAILSDPDSAARQLDELHELGVKVAIDDFGTGYSSLLRLKDLPIAALKIDRAFVAGLPDDPGDRAIVQVVLQLADVFGLTATAEGVEQEAQRASLVELGCRAAQGFLLARPEPATEFATRLGLSRSAPEGRR